MRLREQFLYSEGNKTFTVKKDNSTYKSTYSVCLHAFVKTRSAMSVKFTCHSRKEAKEQLFKLLKAYTNLTMTEILKLK